MSPAFPHSGCNSCSMENDIDGALTWARSGSGASSELEGPVRTTDSARLGGGDLVAENEGWEESPTRQQSLADELRADNDDTAGDGGLSYAEAVLLDPFVRARTAKARGLLIFCHPILWGARERVLPRGQLVLPP